MSASSEDRQQRISLSVQDITVALRVPAREEANYRRAAEELRLTLGLYRTRFPLVGEDADRTHLVMAAIDVAYRSERFKQEADARGIAPRLDALRVEAEELWLEHQSILNRLRGERRQEAQPS